MKKPAPRYAPASVPQNWVMGGVVHSREDIRGQVFQGQIFDSPSRFLVVVAENEWVFTFT